MVIKYRFFLLLPYVRLRFFVAGLLMSMAVIALPLNAEQLRVVTTTSDIAYLAKQVGRDLVVVEHLLPAGADPHFADARPDYIVKLNRADILALIGLDLEIGWLPAVIAQSRNPKIFTGAPGYCDTSVGVAVLDKPAKGADRSMGDIHIYGNPHYWLDPLNAVIMARNLKDAMVRIDPAHKDQYQSNFHDLVERLRQLTKDQLSLATAIKGMQVAVYHNEFTYLANRFGFTIAVSIEEKPGVPPSAAYLQKVIEKMNQENIKLILLSPYSNQRYAQRVAEKTGAKIVVMPISVGSISKVDSYEASIQTMIKLLIEK